MSIVPKIEEWRPVPVVGLEAVYSVSSYGRVRRDVGGQGAQAGKCLSQGKTGSGYPAVVLYWQNKRHDFMTHRLVATAFHGPPPSPTHEVNHKDGVKMNCHEDNLEWMTPSQNQQHCVDTGLRDDRGSKNPRARLTEAQVLEIVASSEMHKTLAKRYGVAPTTITAIKTGANWSHLTGIKLEVQYRTAKNRTGVQRGGVTP